MGKAKKRRKESKPAKPVIRSFWSGTISFGLVSVPVEFFPATRRGSSLRMLAKDGAPLARRYFCPKHKADVHPEHILRGYELDSGEYVVVRDEELESLEPKKTREIDLREFVALAEVSPAMFERGYYLAPAGDTNKAYRLLAAAMENAGKAGIASFVMREKEYLVAIVAENGILSAMTLRFHDELRTPKDIGLPKAAKPSKTETAAFRKVIRSLRADELEESDLAESMTVDLRALAERKLRRGEDVVESPIEEPVASNGDEIDDDEAGQIDLLQAIRRSLKRGAGQRREQGEERARRQQKDESLDEMTKDQLYHEAQELDIDGRSEMSKVQLMRAIEKRKRK
jgi:DNA end-binding protein Ku